MKIRRGNPMLEPKSRPTAKTVSFEAFSNVMFDAAVVASFPGDCLMPRVVGVNPAFERLYGVRQDRCQGRSLSVLGRSDPGGQRRRVLVEARHMNALVEGVGTRRGTNGASIPVRYRVAPLGNVQGERLFLLVERDQRLAAADDLAAEVAGLRDVISVEESLLAGGLDLPAIRQRMADAARQLTGAPAAVVVERVEGRLLGTAVSGAMADYLGMMFPVETTLTGRCCRSGQVLICEDAQTDPRVGDKAGAERLGFRSAAMAPLSHRGRCYGVLKVISPQPKAFGPRHAELLGLVSTALAIALEQSQKLDAESHRRRLLVDALPILISYVDHEQRYQEVNEAYIRWFGEPAERMVGKTVREGLGEKAYESIRPYVEAALRGERMTFETVVAYRDRPRAVEADYIPHRVHGEVLGFYAVIRDIEDRKRAMTDYLTGAMSRFRLDDLFEEVYREAVRYGRPLSLAMIDIDHFKTINDRFGHGVGDQVLKTVATLLREGVRDTDLVGRWGGEEFIVVMPETDMPRAQALAKRLREALATADVGAVGRVTASFGVAQLAQGEPRDALVQRADAALYEAKKRGRDRVEIATASSADAEPLQRPGV